ncbi:hypothetical protein [Microbacterium sp. PMB16]|uniref:hypothetical protein n=1 Tax=Microbacterium sp. PMB16 TaxID=3120157 RepID=UPI003F4BA1FD
MASFVPHSTLVLTGDDVRTLDAHRLGWLLDDAVDRGIGDVIAEVDDVPQALIDAVLARDLRLLVGVTCFHEHGEVTFSAESARRPIGADGKPRERIEWYVGLLPTDHRVVAEIVARCARLAAVPGVSGLVLDFIRWPLHWELEQREDGRRTPAASYDLVTLGDFSDRTGIRVPTDPAEAATELMGVHAERWRRYRAETITHLVRLIADLAHDSGIHLGAFVVPITPEEVGQDVRAWEGFVDVLYPMTYHAILHLEPEWVGDVVASLRQCVSTPVVPVIQLTASAEYSGGWDWGNEIPPADIDAALRGAGSSASAAFFPGTAIRELPRLATPQPEKTRR